MYRIETSPVTGVPSYTERDGIYRNPTAARLAVSDLARHPTEWRQRVRIVGDDGRVFGRLVIDERGWILKGEC